MLTSVALEMASLVSRVFTDDLKMRRHRRQERGNDELHGNLLTCIHAQDGVRARQSDGFRHPFALPHASAQQCDRAHGLLAICAVLPDRGHRACSHILDIFRHAQDGQSRVCIWDTVLLVVNHP